jgi:hypothetical protein
MLLDNCDLVRFVMIRSACWVDIASICRDCRICEPGLLLRTVDDNYLRVRRNVERNGVENIAVLNLAASDRDGEAVLKERGSMSTIVKTPGHSGGNAKFHAIRLDDFAYPRRQSTCQLC